MGVLASSFLWFHSQSGHLRMTGNSQPNTGQLAGQKDCL